MRTIEVMQVGSPVMIGESVPATITGLAVYEKCRVMYECAWWDGRQRRKEWFEQFEVE